MKNKGRWGEMPIAGKWANVFFIKNKQVIVLFQEPHKDGTYHGDIFDKRGFVFQIFKEKEYEVLKIKCIAKAKEFGWNLDNVFKVQKEVNNVCRSNFFSEAIKEINRKGKEKSS